MSGNLMVLLPLLGFMAAMLALGVYVRRQSHAGGFLSGYFVGGQTLGAFVLAMTMVATYSSVSSFVGGPGMAYEGTAMSWGLSSLALWSLSIRRSGASARSR